MELTQVVSNNLQRICREHDLSSRELAFRANMPQKTVYNMIHGASSCQLRNLEKIAKALLVSPTAHDATPAHKYTDEQASAPVGEKYAKLNMGDRDKLESIIDGMWA